MITDEALKAARDREIERAANKRVRQTMASIREQLVPYFPPSYDKVFDELPRMVIAGLEVIEKELYEPAQSQMEDKLYRAVILGVRTMLEQEEKSTSQES